MSILEIKEELIDLWNNNKMNFDDFMTYVADLEIKYNLNIQITNFRDEFHIHKLDLTISQRTIEGKNPFSHWLNISI